MRLWLSGTSCPVAAEKPARNRRGGGGKFLRRRELRELCCSERRSLERSGASLSPRETGGGGGKALRCVVGLSYQQIRRFCFSSSPRRKEKKRFQKTFCPGSVGFISATASSSGGWPAAEWMDGSAVSQSVQVGRSRLSHLESGNRKSG